MFKELLDNQCSHCRAREENISACAGYKVVHYCSKDHQAAHWHIHKQKCKDIKKARAKIEKEKGLLLEEEPTIFENYTGHFWGRIETRPYMRARTALIEALRKVKTRQAVQVSLDFAMENLRLCRGDNMGTRGSIPAMMIRLGQDQEAYDFIKWYSTAGEDDHYDWGDMTLPFLNLHNEDVFESIDAAQSDPRFGKLAFQTSLVLIKLRLLTDLRSPKNSMALGEKVPQEILDTIQENLITNVIAKNQAIMRDVKDGKDLKHHIDTLEVQTNAMYAQVHERNKHFWPTMPNAEEALETLPEYYSQGEFSEVVVVLQSNYAAWKETPGAVDWVEEKLNES